MATKLDEVNAQLIDRLSTLPEPEALACYSQLTPRLQWLARLQTVGKRREALITHHAIKTYPYR